jgi:EndoU nuclease-like protein
MMIQADAFGLLASALDNRAPEQMAKLLGVSAASARSIVSSYVKCDHFHRDVVRARLKHLLKNGHVTQAHSFLKLVARFDDEPPPMFEPFLTQHPDLQPWIRKARLLLRKSPRELLKHIAGVTISGSQLKAGGHRLSAIERLADNAVKSLSKQELTNLRTHMPPELAREMRTEIRAMYGSMGLNLSGDRWRKFYLIHQTLWRIDTKPNGVQCFRIPRRYFNGHGWGNTITSAQYGISPVGGKSLFPKKWTDKKILEAVGSVVKHPDAVVLRRGNSHNSEPKFFLRARVDNVDVEVGFEGSAIRTTFPSWRQYRPGSIKLAYAEWFMARGRLWEQRHQQEFDDPIFLKVPFPDGFVTGYLGKCPPGISESEWPKLALWLNPKHVEIAPHKQQVLTLHLTIFEWLERSRVVQELEGASGPVH